MKKKMITGLLGVMAAAAMALPVSAADDTMTVQYSQATTYTLSIPATITLSENQAAQAENIGVSAVNTEPGKKVQVKVSSGITNNQVELVRTGDTTTKVVSDVTDKDGNKVSNGFVVAEFQDMSTTPITAGTGILNFSAIRDSAGGTVKAGSYTGTIVFEASVEDR